MIFSLGIIVCVSKKKGIIVWAPYSSINRLREHNSLSIYTYVEMYIVIVRSWLNMEQQTNR